MTMDEHICVSFDRKLKAPAILQLTLHHSGVFIPQPLSCNLKFVTD
jgi:hypothetical protein